MSKNPTDNRIAFKVARNVGYIIIDPFEFLHPAGAQASVRADVADLPEVQGDRTSRNLTWDWNVDHRCLRMNVV